MKTELFHDRNVYILGAGFSFDAGLPLVKDFMNRMRDSLSWLKNANRHYEAKAVEDVFDFRLRASSAAERIPLDAENIEELFSLASAAGSEHATGDFSRAIPLAIAATLDFSLASKTNPPIQRVQPYQGWQVPPKWEHDGPLGQTPTNPYLICPVYDLYALIMAGLPDNRADNRRDSIVSFNYDLVLEDALHRLSIPFSYGLTEEDAELMPGAFCVPPNVPQSIQLLKLHGSTNWAAPDRKQKGKLKIFSTYDGVREQRNSPFLAPPTWRKVFGDQLSTVWDLAVDALQTATRVIILGYSIPATDQHFKFLLGAGLQENISLRRILFVNNGLGKAKETEILRGRLFRVLRPELEPNTVAPIKSDVHQFLLRDGWEEMNRRLPTGMFLPYLDTLNT
jgi:hypothetical protein